MDKKEPLPEWTKDFPSIIFAAEKYPDFRKLVFEEGAHKRRVQLNKKAKDLVGDVIKGKR